MRKIKLLLGSVFLIFFTFALTAQSSYEWIPYKISGRSATNLVIQGDYLWVGSNAGLTKIDLTDQSSVNFNKSNSPLPSNEILSLAVDESGSLWIGTDFCLVKYQNENWTIFDEKNSAIPYQKIYSLLVDYEGVL